MPHTDFKCGVQRKSPCGITRRKGNTEPCGPAGECGWDTGSSLRGTARLPMLSVLRAPALVGWDSSVTWDKRMSPPPRWRGGSPPASSLPLLITPLFPARFSRFVYSRDTECWIKAIRGRRGSGLCCLGKPRESSVSEREDLPCTAKMYSFLAERGLSQECKDGLTLHRLSMGVHALVD